MLRLGFQTLPFGKQVPTRDDLLRLREMGYRGIELAQHPRLYDVEDLVEAAEDAQIQIVSLTNGPLPKRIESGHRFGIDYLYVDEYFECPRNEDTGIPIAFHPHVYKDFGSVEGYESLLEGHPDLGLIVDTAHFRLVGDDPACAVRDHLERLHAIHIKDWSKKHGRSPLRIARGFCPLGKGDLEQTNKETVAVALECGFDAWMIVEQDYASGSVLEDADRSIQWLRENTVIGELR